MADLTRRKLLIGAAGTAVAASVGGPVLGQSGRPDVVVIGAGVFGVWTALKLQAAGKRVALVDAWGPANARASSGGESRMTRAVYGPDEIYTRMALDSLPEWRALSDRAGLPIFAPVGVLFFFGAPHPYATAAMEMHRRLGLSTRMLDTAEMARRFAGIDFAGIELGLFEPDFGVLMARRAVQTLVLEFVRAGGDYVAARVAPPLAGAGRLGEIRTDAGTRIEAESFVFAAGPWLPRLFPDILARRIRASRQEVFFFAPPPGDARFQPGPMPGWADFNGGDLYYGMPDMEARGFKIAFDRHGPEADPDQGDRTYSPEMLAQVRAYMARRFPAMADRPLNEARVCQYENSANGDLLIDRHPAWENVTIVGAGSGHGFKHGPAVGRYAADLVLGGLGRVEPRFSLASKGEVENREVH
ncbi:MAG: FAD-dependent oxidoreductase [Sphingosinicella sp.]|uniref:FAD-dependent oxidoreductase n=1 Tax=Sphingosinicella sp. TaxID=1917971 RepID=UPI00403772DD